MEIESRDIEIINNQIFNPNALPMFDMLKSCLTWSDEQPLVPLTSKGREFLTDLWIVRGFIHQSTPKAQWGLDPCHFEAVWEYGLQKVSQWPGFKRLSLSDSDKEYLAECLKTPLARF